MIYLDYFSDHFSIKAAYNISKKIIIEVVCIVAATTFNAILAEAITGNLPTALKTRVIKNIVDAPLHEELIFRGLTNLIQKIFPTSSIPTIGQGVFFGMMHLGNNHRSLGHELWSFSISTFAGTAFGFLSRKYETISLGIAAHGLHNTLAMKGKFAKNKNSHIYHLCLAGNICLQIFWMVLGTTNFIQERIKPFFYPLEFDSIELN